MITLQLSSYDDLKLTRELTEGGVNAYIEPNDLKNIYLLSDCLGCV